MNATDTDDGEQREFAVIIKVGTSRIRNRISNDVWNLADLQSLHDQRWSDQSQDSRHRSIIFIRARVGPADRRRAPRRHRSSCNIMRKLAAAR